MIQSLISLKEQAITAQPVTNDVVFQWLQSIDVSEKTRATYGRNIRGFMDFLTVNGITNPTKKNIIQYRDGLLSAGKKPATVTAYLMALKQLFHWTQEAGIYPDISATVKAPKTGTEHKKDPLTIGQAGDVLQAIDRTTAHGLRDYAIISCMITSGLRTVEIIRANIGDVVTVSNGRESFPVLYIQGKGHAEKDQYIKLAPPVMDALKAYINSRDGAGVNDPLFASLSNRDNGGRMTTRSISRICKNAFTAAGIDSPRITAHSLRHTAATINLLNGATIEETQQLLRHRNINTTLIYSHALQRAENMSENRIAAAIFQ